MSPSKKKLYLSWYYEVLFLFLQILSLILFFIPIPQQKKGTKNSIVIISDLLTSPILYLYLQIILAKKQYKVYFFSGFSPFEKLYEKAKRLSSFLEKINENKITLLAHGTGGLLPLSLSNDARKKVLRFISLNTPFFGTNLFNSLDFIPAFKDLLVRSEYLIQFRMNALLYEEFYPFVAWSDEWIFPDTLLKFGQGRDILLDIPGRLNLILNKENVETLANFIDNLNKTEEKKLEKQSSKIIINSKKSKKNK